MYFNLLITCVALLLGSLSAQAENIQSAHSLDGSYEKMQNANNKRFFRQELSGDDAAQWISYEANKGAIDIKSPKNKSIYKSLWISLKDDDRQNQPSTSVHVGFKQFTKKSNEYFGWIYWERYYQPNKPVLEPKIAMGLFTLNPEDYTLHVKPNVKPLTTFVLSSDETFLDFDWAPYQLGPLGRAVGVRTERISCGAGGSICSNELLRLFSVQEPSIEEVFIAVIGYFGDYAGDWHKDFTRDHFVEELNGILKVNASKEKRDTPPSLTLKAKWRKRWLARNFEWTTRPNGSLHYETRDKEIFPLVLENQTLNSPPWSRK